MDTFWALTIVHSTLLDASTVTSMFTVMCYLKVLLLIATVHAAALPNCSTKESWKEVNGLYYCMNSEDMMSYDDSREFCQLYGADLVVLDTEERFKDVLQLLYEESVMRNSSTVSVFLGVYQKRCTEREDVVCTWLVPYTGRWYWINSNEQITRASSTFWQALDSTKPYITNFHSLTEISKNVQHFIFSSNNRTKTVDPFADEAILVKLNPLCVRNSATITNEQTTPHKQMAEPVKRYNSNGAEGGVKVAGLLLFLVVAVFLFSY